MRSKGTNRLSVRPIMGEASLNASGWLACSRCQSVLREENRQRNGSIKCPRCGSVCYIGLVSYGARGATFKGKARCWHVTGKL